ncbi:MAG: metal ABC transporter substrate-binding protein [Spirochaetes bacterium]|nr:metal ABC transporter substrate-binding protein [Spirochaetota bacterium]
MSRLAAAAAVLLALASCSRAGAPDGARVIAAETFLADIARQVAGDRIAVQALLPPGVDPHAWEPAPRDAAAVAAARLLIVSGAGLEAFLSPLLDGLGAGGPRVVEASAGLTPRAPRMGEPAADAGQGEIDPHFWLDPLNVIRYAENIRDALSELDPAGAAAFRANASAYAEKLRELDRWIADEVSRIPVERRLLVTNHESLGYFADRYGFRVVGAVVPSVSTGSTPSAKQLAALVGVVRAAGVKVLFVEDGGDPRLARQLADEAGIRLVTGLGTHSLTGPEGAAPTYLAMMRADVRLIVDALGAP